MLEEVAAEGRTIQRQRLARFFHAKIRDILAETYTYCLYYCLYYYILAETYTLFSSQTHTRARARALSHPLLPANTHMRMCVHALAHTRTHTHTRIQS